MRTFRALAVVTTAAGLLTGLPLSNALACDNDRFPCPIVSDAPETTEAPSKATSTAPARNKKAAPRQDERAAAHQDEKTRPKTERDASRAPSRAKAASRRCRSSRSIRPRRRQRR
jgi:predicted cobalt transporter CbtA